MYITSQLYKCIRCGYETKYSPHDMHSAPVTEDFIGCPRCYERFLKENLGEIKCTVKFNGESSYGNALRVDRLISGYNPLDYLEEA